MTDPELHTLLDNYNAETLHEMVKATTLLDGVSKKPAKAKLVELMMEKYFTRERVLASLDKLNKTQYAVLIRLQQVGNEITNLSFQRQLERAKITEAAPATSHRFNNEYSGSPFKPNSKVFEDVLARLTYLGLVFSRVNLEDQGYTYKLDFNPGRTIFIPDVVSRHLPPPPPLVEREDFTPAIVKNGDGQQFLRNLYLYWDFVRRTPVDLLQSGVVGKRSLKAINSVLLVPDPAMQNANKEEEATTLYLYRLLLEILKLLKHENNRLLVEDADKQREDFWGLDFEAQAQALVNAWGRLSIPLELDETTSKFAPNVRNAHSRLLELLGQQGERWCYPLDLLEMLQTKDQNYLFPRRTAAEAGRGNYVFYEYGFYGDSKEVIKRLDQAEEQLIRYTIEQILFRLGLAELNYEKAGSTTWNAARLTAVGQRVLKQQSASSERSLREAKPEYRAGEAPTAGGGEGRVVVQPNFQVLAMGPVPISALALLDRFAERRKADLSVFEYYLTRQSVYNGLQGGLTADVIEATLRDFNGGELPQNVQRSLHEWGAHHDRIIFRSNVTLLQAATPELLNLLLDNAKTGKYLERSLTSEVAVVEPEQLQKLQKALLAHEMLPAISDDKPAAADNSITISDSGEIHPIHSVPNLHLTGRLARIAEVSKTGWHLTKSSVRNASGNRKQVEELLAELRKLHRGELPEAVVANVKKWGLYYGSATVETLTLIEFSDRNILNALLKHPKLKETLVPYKAGDRAVMTVAAKDLKQVQKLLTDLGVEIKL